MQNIGTSFTMDIYSCRWGHKDPYTLTKTENGWNISSSKFDSLESDKHGSPGIGKALDSDSIAYPNSIGYFLSDLWDASQLKTKEETQKLFDQLAEWISTSEETKPNFGPLHI